MSRMNFSTFLFIAGICFFLTENAASMSSVAVNKNTCQHYKDYALGLEVTLPEFSRMLKKEHTLRVDFPVRAGTYLREKYILIEVNNHKNKENYPFLMSKMSNSETGISINGVRFKKVIAEEKAAGVIYDVCRYRTVYNGRLIDIKCVLHRVNPGALDTKVKVVSITKEMEAFEEIINSIKMLFKDEPSLVAREFLESQPLSKPVTKVGTVYQMDKEALVYATRKDNTRYKVNLAFDKKNHTWYVKSASELGEDVMEHNRRGR